MMSDDNTAAPDEEDDKTQIAAPADDQTQVDPVDDDLTQIVEQSAGADKPTSTAPPAIAPAPKPQVAAPASSQGAPVPIGTLINNNYEVKELINAGGMGEVFRGENVFTGDAVAIKIVLQSLAHDEKVAALFMREARVLCQLSDQAIVRYYNFVRDAELDRFCLIMEFIEGVPLSDHIRDVAPLTLDQTRGLMRRIAAGLDRAHQMEVIHRDLSPDNVMLRDGSVEDSVLIDFGIAKSAEMAENTLHGQLAGKFKYISPEQLGHFDGIIGPRTDVYGLGLMMAAALRGTPLEMGSSVVEAVNARREIPDLDEIDPSIRPLLAHMLEPNPADRPPRMSDVIAMLDDPNAVPAKYGGGGTGGKAPATPVVPVPGLRQPPMRQQTTGGIGAQTPADPASASPFGDTAGLPHVPPSDEGNVHTGGSILRWALVLVVLSAVGGFIAWQQGMFGAQPAGAGDPDPVVGATESDGGLDPATREGFLASWSDNDCVFVTRIQAGPNSGMIAGFAGNPSAFDGLIDGYEAAFGARPTLVDRRVSPEQCPTLSLANALRGPDAVPPVLSLDSDVMEDGGTIVARVSNRRGRSVWVAWVSTDGIVYNLTERLTEQPDGSATFDLSLSLATEDALPTPELLIAITTERPLFAAAALSNAKAADLLPLIETEIVDRSDTQASIALSGFEFRP